MKSIIDFEKYGYDGYERLLDERSDSYRDELVKEWKDRITEESVARWIKEYQAGLGKDELRGDMPERWIEWAWNHGLTYTNFADYGDPGVFAPDVWFGYGVSLEDELNDRVNEVAAGLVDITREFMLTVWSQEEIDEVLENRAEVKYQLANKL